MQHSLAVSEAEAELAAASSSWQTTRSARVDPRLFLSRALRTITSLLDFDHGGGSVVFVSTFC